MCETKETPSIDGDEGYAPSLRAILEIEEDVRERAGMIGELLLIEVVRTGPDGMECDKFDREDPQPFRIDTPDALSGGVSWHLTLSYNGPMGDALGCRARWSDSGEIAAECVIDTLGLVEALASGRLSSFFKELADWLESNVQPRGLATEGRIEEGAKIARDLARDLESCRDPERSQDLDRMMGGDPDLWS